MSEITARKRRRGGRILDIGVLVDGTGERLQVKRIRPLAGRESSKEAVETVIQRFGITLPEWFGQVNFAGGHQPFDLGLGGPGTEGRLAGRHEMVLHQQAEQVREPGVDHGSCPERRG